MKALRLSLLALCAGAIAFILFQQHGESRVLRAELELARMERDEVTRLRQAQQRLQSQAPPDSALTKLREEQAAIRRLRAELESLKSRLART